MCHCTLLQAGGQNSKTGGMHSSPVGTEQVNLRSIQWKANIQHCCLTYCLTYCIVLQVVYRCKTGLGLADNCKPLTKHTTAQCVLCNRGCAAGHCQLCMLLQATQSNNSDFMGLGTTSYAKQDEAAGEAVQDQTTCLDADSPADQLRAERSLQAWHTPVRLV